mmetsp:Transcript_21614/g.48957  ORF Transcript_21614/g.48957 Transcript_21614/m.48957 type:complete len:327 (-) Transcript_21614:774-1754(-)
MRSWTGCFSCQWDCPFGVSEEAVIPWGSSNPAGGMEGPEQYRWGQGSKVGREGRGGVRGESAPWSRSRVCEPLGREQDDVRLLDLRCMDLPARRVCARAGGKMAPALRQEGRAEGRDSSGDNLAACQDRSSCTHHNTTDSGCPHCQGSVRQSVVPGVHPARHNDRRAEEAIQVFIEGGVDSSIESLLSQHHGLFLCELREVAGSRRRPSLPRRGRRAPRRVESGRHRHRLCLRLEGQGHGEGGNQRAPLQLGGMEEDQRREQVKGQCLPASMRGEWRHHHDCPPGRSLVPHSTRSSSAICLHDPSLLTGVRASRDQGHSREEDSEY